MLSKKLGLIGAVAFIAFCACNWLSKPSSIEMSEAPILGANMGRRTGLKWVEGPLAFEEIKLSDGTPMADCKIKLLAKAPILKSPNKTGSGVILKDCEGLSLAVIPYSVKDHEIRLIEATLADGKTYQVFIR